jgi:hypothetical protein
MLYSNSPSYYLSILECNYSVLKSVQKVLLYNHLSKNERIKIYKTIILPLALRNVDSHPREEHAVLENRAPRRLFGPEG